MLAGFRLKALGQRRQNSVGLVEFEALDAVHGKKNNCRSKGLAIFDHGGKIIEGRELDAANTEALRRKGKNLSPEFVPGIAQRDNYQRTRRKGSALNRRQSFILG